APCNNSRFSGAGAGNGMERQLREVYDVVLRAQQAGIAALHPGAKSGGVDSAARGVIEAAGYGKYFTHSIGHGIGMQVHEAQMVRETTVAEEDQQAGSPFDVTTVRALVALMGRHDLSEIDLRQGDHRIRLRRGALKTTLATLPSLVATPPPAQHSSPPAKAPA